MLPHAQTRSVKHQPQNSEASQSHGGDYFNWACDRKIMGYYYQLRLQYFYLKAKVICLNTQCDMEKLKL